MATTKFRLLLAGIIACSAVLMVSIPVQAAVIDFFDFSKFNGGAPTPTLRATITDLAGGGVEIAMFDLPGTDAEKVQAWYFNLINVPGTITFVSGLNRVEAASVQYAQNAFKADGTGGFFDLLFTYDSDPNSIHYFNVGSNSVYKVLGVTSDDFLTLSSGGSYYSAVQQSSWWGDDSYTTSVVPTPEPGSLILFGLGLFGLAGFAGNRKK